MENPTESPGGGAVTLTGVLPPALARLADSLDPMQLHDLDRGLVEVDQLLDIRAERIVLDFDRFDGPTLRHETCGRVIGLGEAGEVVRSLAKSVRDRAAGR